MSSRHWPRVRTPVLIVGILLVAALTGSATAAIVGRGPAPQAAQRVAMGERPAGKPRLDSAGHAAITIPALGVHAGILSEGIDHTPGDAGNLAVPPDPDHVGWWDHGPAPGQPGVAVLAGHRMPGGAFWKLPRLRKGDTIRVTNSYGHTTRWKVTAVRKMLKARLPKSVWSASGRPWLALVTCGGAFDNSTGHYVDNVIVWAARA